MATEEITDPEVEQVNWNLEDLVDGRGAGGVETLLDEAQQRADAFAERYAGNVAELDGPGLEEAMRALEEIGELGGRAGSYAMLDFSVDTQDPARGALVAKVTERSTAIETKLVFFELEWAALDDDRAEELLQHPGLDFARHYLRNARRYRPHLLTEPEEKLMAEKSQTGRSAWGRLFAELMSDVKVDGEPLEIALSRLMHPDREVRRTTAEAVTEALQPGLRTRAYIFNTLALDKAVDDRLRHYASWIQSRNLSNEASDESVEALVQAVQGRYEIARRWYRLKAKLLGIDRLADYDRIAPVVDDEQRVGWSEAKAMVLDSYNAFSPDLGAVAGDFFERRWIDAAVRPAKRGGAFCAYTVPSVHPYVLLNWTARRRDVLTLAHELGHGVHAALARPQGLFQQGTPLTLAETASVFGEQLVFGRLLDEAADAESRLALLAEAIEGQIATVFRQIAMNRFEHALHTARRSEGELAVDRIGELWKGSQEDLLGDAVEVTDGYRSWWSYVPHFVNTPGYVYAYAYGQLLALSVYRRYEEEGEGFVPAYLDLLRAGGSKSPEELGAIVGIDLADPGFWDAGLDLVERDLQAAEDAARDARGVTL
ncbi:MAG TPA: M3 family oligoendopeptidase [Solirubrobacteraceae bacterium]|jgi:oligoendopeptidase F